MKKLRSLLAPLSCVAVNLLVAMLLLSISRVLFILENAPVYPGVSFSHFAYLCKAGLRFDLSAMFYVNSVYIVLALLPLAARTGKVYGAVTKFFYVVPNFLALAVNLADSVYFQFTGRRTTCSFFSEFKNESNLSSIFFQSCLEHWYLGLAGLAMLALLICLYRRPKTECRQSLGYDKPYVCFGCDLLSTPDEETWAVNYSEGIYRFFTDSPSIQFDGKKAIGAYSYKEDPLQKNDILELKRDEVEEALPKLKALIQQYICRMLEDRLTD